MSGAISKRSPASSHPGISQNRWTTTLATASTLLMTSTNISQQYEWTQLRAVTFSFSLYKFLHQNTRCHIPGVILRVPLSRETVQFWGFKTAGLWRCDVTWGFPDVQKRRVSLMCVWASSLKGADTRKIMCVWSPTDTASHSGTLEHSEYMHLTVTAFEILCTDLGWVSIY
jgi:hypothetical protein